jgi:hypothetical protein
MTATVKGRAWGLREAGWPDSGLSGDLGQNLENDTLASPIRNSPFKTDGQALGRGSLGVGVEVLDDLRRDVERLVEIE